MNRIRTLLLSALSLAALTLGAQAPQSFSYQAVARDVDGDPLAGQPVGVQFQLHQGTAIGPVVFAESHATATNDHGLFTLQVGNGTPGLGTFSAIDWRSGPYFLEVLLDASSSGSFTSMGTQQLLSVPYALHAGSSSDLPHGTEVGQIMHWDGNVWVADSGLYVQGKRFGIGGETTPEAPLGIKGEPGQDDRMISFHSSDGSQKWNINLNPTGNDVDGFSIDDATSGVGSSRLFIAGSSGNVGIGNTEPDAPLGIKSRSELYQEFQNGDIPDQNDFYFTTGNNTGFAIEEDTAGGTATRMMIQSGTGHVGIGTNDPPAPLALVSRSVLKQYFQSGDHPDQSQFGFTLTDTTGFGIDQGIPGSMTSRFFIQGSTGFIGMGTTQPEQKLHIEESAPAGITGLKILNTANSNSTGWVIGQLDDPDPDRDGTLLFGYGGVDDAQDATVVYHSRIGINEDMPDTKLHVSRPVAEPGAALGLQEGTGIAQIGPMTDNVVFDYRGLQARKGSYLPGDVLDISASDLNLQRMGGDILIHGDATFAETLKGIITAEGWLGLGTIEPVERVEIDGAIKIGNSSNEAEGTIRWTGTDFEGRKAGAWKSLTTHTNTDGLWQSGSPGEISYDPVGVEGSVGVGTTDPQQKLHVSGANDGGNVSIMVENLGSSPDGGWLMSAVDDNAVTARQKTFAIQEKKGSDLVERITILGDNNVGINEVLPYATLHVSRPLSDPSSAVSLAENTGIVMVGPISDNIVQDYRGIQARHGEYVGGGPTLSFTTSELNLQRLGGNILIHGDDAVDHQVSITADGKIGVGKVATEKLEIDGAIVIGNTSTASPAPGSIRFNDSKFEVWNSGDWAISDGTIWQKVDNSDVITAGGAHPKVAIGTTTSSSSLRVDSWAAVVERSVGAHFQNTSPTSSTSPNDHRVGVQILNTGTWGGDPSSKNIGLYVSEVSGQTQASSNLAAVLNGNTVIGGVTGDQMVGTGGTNVLAIQNGTTPADGLSGGPGSVGGIQVYSADVSGVPTLHVMNGNGDVIQLYRASSITAPDNSPLGPGVDPSTALLIDNMRTRINELENILKALGLLTP